MNEKDILQEDQYEFPYHFIPDITDGAIVTNRFLQWSMMYMSYINFVRDEIVKSEATNILDVGCGDGRLIYELEKVTTEKKYLGIDISERALKFATAFTSHSTFEVFDIIQKPYPVQHDLIAYIETIEHIPPDLIKPMIANMAASLKDDGILLITTPTTNLPTAKKHYQHFTKESIESYIGDYFEIIDVQYFNVENWASKLLARTLVNKLITINPVPVRKLVYALYQKYCFIGTEKTGSRIFVKAKRK